MFFLIPDQIRGFAAQKTAEMLYKQLMDVICSVCVMAAISVSVAIYFPVCYSQRQKKGVLAITTIVPKRSYKLSPDYTDHLTERDIPT